MAISDIPSALAQYNANLDWQNNPASADLALQAIRYLFVNRAQRVGDVGSIFDYESLKSEKEALEKFLGATPRSNGRFRRVAATFNCGGIA